MGKNHDYPKTRKLRSDGTTRGLPQRGHEAYIRICAGPQRHKYVHTLVAQAMLGRELTEHETVEHSDGNTFNNDWRNLRVVSRAENSRLKYARYQREAGQQELEVTAGEPV
jgi:hypothetical protein